MRKSCNNVCTVAVVHLKRTTLYTVIDDFTNNFDMNSDNIGHFYNQIIQKYKITCETGLLFVEKLFMYNLFHKFRLSSDNTNIFINEKILLYQWIKPSHLNLPEIDLSNYVSEFSKIQHSNVPSVKIFHMMTGFQRIYNDLGRDTDYDIVLSIVVFAFIKAQIKDIHTHIKFMKTFKRDYYKKCEADCCHGFSINVCCTCLTSQNWNGEEEYYLTTCEAALTFIKQLEYCNLNIEVTEFDNRIIDKMNNINFDGPLSPYFQPRENKKFSPQPESNQRPLDNS